MLVFPRVPSRAIWSDRYEIELCFRHEVFRIAYLICRRNGFKDLARYITEFIQVDHEKAWARLCHDTREWLKFSIRNVILRGPGGDIYPRSYQLKCEFISRVGRMPRKRFAAIDRGDVTAMVESKEDPGSGASLHVNHHKHFVFHMWALGQADIKYEGRVKLDCLVADLI